MYVTITLQIFVTDLWLAAVKTADIKQRSQYHPNKTMFFHLGHLIIIENKYQIIPAV